VHNQLAKLVEHSAMVNSSTNLGSSKFKGLIFVTSCGELTVSTVEVKGIVEKLCIYAQKSRSVECFLRSVK
jgi:hypothetical protein